MPEPVAAIALALGLGLLAACTSTTVRPVESDPPLGYVCIRENPRVLVDDFVPVVRDALSEHGIRSEVFSTDQPPDHCDAVLTYTALRSWDLGSYLSHAEVRVERNGLQIGYGEYHLRGKGGYSMFKWQGTAKKMRPVLEELLQNVHASSADGVASPAESPEEGQEGTRN